MHTTIDVATAPSRRPRRSRRIAAAVALTVTAAVMAGGLATSASALPPPGHEPVPPPTTTPPPPPPTTPPPPPPTTPPGIPGTPRFAIQAVSFRAVDETGWDGSWWAPVSDEPFFVWSSTNASSGMVTTRRSPVFGDVDTGESRTFYPAICVVASCTSGVTGPIGLNTVAMENDLGDPDTVKSYVENAVAAAHWVSRIFGYELPSTYDSEIIGFLTSWFGDDLISERSVTWSPAELATAMPYVGSVFYETIDYAGSDGHYTVTYKLTRKTDLPPVLQP